MKLTFENDLIRFNCQAAAAAVDRGKLLLQLPHAVENRVGKNNEKKIE